MLRLAQSFLNPRTGLLFLVLPAPCIQNSRYLDRARLVQILETVGLSVLKEKLKPGGKLAYFLCRRANSDERDRRLESSQFTKEGEIPRELTSKITLREGSSRNNFAILLPTP